MPPVIPDQTKIRAFRTQRAFEAWMRAHHARETEIWVKIHKKGSGLPTVSVAEALDVVLTANAKARKTFATLGKMNLFALTFRTNDEDARRAREEDRHAGGDAGARRDDRAGGGEPPEAHRFVTRGRRGIQGGARHGVTP